MLIEIASQITGVYEEAVAGTLETALERGAIEDAAIAALARAAPRVLEAARIPPEAQVSEGGSIKHDVSGAVSAVPALMRGRHHAVEAFIPGCRVVPLAISAMATFISTFRSRSARTGRRFSPNGTR